MVVATGEVRLSGLLRRDAGAEVDRLYRRHSGEVLRYALLVLRSRSDAEDVTQAVFMRALRALEAGEKVRAPRNWLLKIAHNESRRLLASRKATVELPEGLAAEPDEPGRADELKRALAALPEAQRRALVLRELEGRSYNEISAALSVSVSAIETLIFRARRSLREQLEGAMSCDEFPALLDEPSARSQVRAHARICAACATLERQARGRKGALKRIASALGLPWWVPKLAAVAVTTATVAGVAAAVPPAQHSQRQPAPIPRSGTGVEQFFPAATPARAFTHAHRPVVAPARAAGRSFAPVALPARPSRPVARRSPARRAVLPGPEPAPTPEPAPGPGTPEPAPVPPPVKVAPAAQPAPQPGPGLGPAPVALPPAPPVPAVAVPPVPDVPPVPVPAVTVPPVTVPLPPLPPPAVPPVPNVSGP